MGKHLTSVSERMITQLYKYYMVWDDPVKHWRKMLAVEVEKQQHCLENKSSGLKQEHNQCSQITSLKFAS